MFTVHITHFKHCISFTYSHTIDRCLPRQNHDDELQPTVGVLQVSEHWFHAVSSLGVFAETWLALDWHPSIL